MRRRHHRSRHRNRRSALAVATLVATAAILPPSRTDDGRTATASRAIARRHAGDDFAEARAAFSSWQPGPSSRRIFEVARELLFEEDGFLREPSGSAAVERRASDHRDDDRYARLLERALKSVLEVSGDSSAEAFHLLAVLSYRNSRSEGALRYASRAVLLEPFSSGYHSNLGFLLQSVGEIRAASALYLRARRLDPENTAAHVGLLSLAPRSTDMRLVEIRALVDDWMLRERDASLKSAARTIQSALRDLPASLDERPLAPSPADGREREPRPDLRQLEALRRALLELFPSAKATATTRAREE